MRVLAFDTAADFCAVLLWQSGAVCDHRLVQTERDQAKILAPLTQSLLAANGLELAAIDRLAVATGPGSFTGLRVGLAFVRGLALAMGDGASQVGVIGSDHFRCLHHGLHHALHHGLQVRNVLIVCESKRAELFACSVEDGVAGAYFMADAKTLVGHLHARPHQQLAGQAAQRLMAQNPALAARFLPLPALAAAQSAAMLAAHWQGGWPPLPTPFYLREADVTPPANPCTVIPQNTLK